MSYEFAIDADIMKADYKGDGGQSSHARVVESPMANRIDNKVAQSILDADDKIDSFRNMLKEARQYDATALFYEQNLEAGDPKLLRKQVPTTHLVRNLRGKVKKQSADMFRIMLRKTTNR